LEILVTSYPNPSNESNPLGPPTNTPPDYTSSAPGASSPYVDPAYQTSVDPVYQTAVDPGFGTGATATTGGSAAFSSSIGGSKTDAAKSEAADVKDTALSAGSQVAGTAKDQASNVLAEAGSQARGLLDQVRFELREQGRGQKDRMSSLLHSLSKELGQMASKSEESGPMTDLAHQASRRGGEVAHWLENHEPADVLEEVRRFARRRPVAFLALAAAAGAVVGRLGRGAVAANTSLDSRGGDAGYRPTDVQSLPPAPATYAVDAPLAPAYEPPISSGYATPPTGVMNAPGDDFYGTTGTSGAGTAGSYGAAGGTDPYGSAGGTDPYRTVGGVDPYGNTGTSTGDEGSYPPPAEGGYPR